MKINKVVFMCEELEKSPDFYNNISKMEISINRGDDRPTIFVDAGLVKFEDRSYTMDVENVLEQIGKIDFELKNDIKCPGDYCGNKWKLIVNDKEYEDAMEEPHYVIKFKRIIRYTAIDVYMRKRIGRYLKWVYCNVIIM